MADIEITVEGLDEFLDKLRRAAHGGFEAQVALWLESMGEDFLDIVQDEIIGTETVEYRLLLSSFNRGHQENYWEVSNGGLTLGVGTNVNYAAYVNDGHWTTREGVRKRWVPGYFITGPRGEEKFVYDPNADTGMVLYRKWVEGTHYWELAAGIFKEHFGRNLERRLQQWIDDYF